MDLLEQLTALPNLHPALVHFPIALAPVALLLDLAALLQRSRRSDWVRAATALWVLAALGAWAAWWAGGRAADSLVGLSAQAQARIGTHSDWGLYTLWTFAVIALLRLLAGRRLGNGRGTLAVATALGLGASALVAYTADLGGGLVYRLGVAVERPATDRAAPPSDDGESPGATETTAGAVAQRTDPTARLETRDDGGVVWTPAAEDSGAVGSILVPATGAALDPVRVIDPGAASLPGLVLEVDGRTLLTLPGTFGDVEVVAVVDLHELSGTFGLAHHVRDATHAGLLTVRPADGAFALVTLDSDEKGRKLAEAVAELPPGAASLAVSAAGRHLRGMLEGELVVHGHEPALPEGGAGLLIDGKGSVRIEKLVVTPIGH